MRIDGWAQGIAVVLACTVVPLTVTAGYAAGVADAPQRGKIVYESGCVSCHGIDGEGAMPGVPDLTVRDGPLSKTDAVLLKNLRAGLQSPGSTMAMPPKGGNPALTDVDLRDVLIYLRSRFSQGAK